MLKNHSIQKILAFWNECFKKKEMNERYWNKKSVMKTVEIFSLSTFL